MVTKLEIIWNIIASAVASMLSAVLLLFCTRINGIEIAGIFSISFATATILNAIGDYGIRVYQVTDTNRKYTFGEYKASRIIVVLIMVVIGLLFVLISGYNIEKLVITMLLISFRAIDNLSETYQAEFQINNRLDKGAKSVTIRNLSALLVFLGTDFITKNVVVSTISLVMTNIILFILYDVQQIKQFNIDMIKFNKKNILSLLKDCLPVCIATLLSLYITNAVKYSIDKFR